MAYFFNKNTRQAIPGMQSMPYAPCDSVPLHTGIGQQGLAALPTGFPTGSALTPIIPFGQVSTGQLPGGQMPAFQPPFTQMPSVPALAAPPGEQAPQTLQSTMYTPGYLRTQIGRRVRVEFLIGSNGPLVDRIGTLLGVGASYILLQPVDSDDILLCDIYSIKFVTILL